MNTGWINVEDALPDTDSDCYLLFVEFNRVCFGWFSQGNFYEDNTDYDGGALATKLEDVTHWMPLPEPPTAY